MNDTPRTDAQLWVVKEGGFVKGDHIKGETEVVSATVARKLERDRAALVYAMRRKADGDLSQSDARALLRSLGEVE